jgi:DNA modification methylase
MQTTKTDLNVEYIDVDALVPARSNARTHSKRQIRMISRAIERFGFTNPILISATHEIIAGHGRVEAAKLLGLRKVPTIRIDYLSEAERRAYIIADNRLAEKAGWDREILQIELQNIVAAEIDVETVGFEIAEADFLLHEVVERSEDIDAFDERPAIKRESPPISRDGDLWLLGAKDRQHHLLCGDCRSAQNTVTATGNRQAAMLITDVPYNVKINGHVSGKGRTQHPEFAMASGEMSTNEYTDFLTDFLEAALPYLSPEALLYIFIDWRHLFELLSASRALRLHQVNLCVWNKNNGGMGSLYRSKHELVLVFGRSEHGHQNNVQLGKFGRNRTKLWDYAGANIFYYGRDKDLAIHPTVKPVQLVADAIRDVTDRNHLVLDPFGGSGTTIIAAEKTGRRAASIEIDPHYCDAAIRRWEKLTGKEAVLQSTNETFETVHERRQREHGLSA